LGKRTSLLVITLKIDYSITSWLYFDTEHGDRNKMSTNKIITLLFISISLIILSACEQQAASPARTSYDSNVHEKEFGNYIIHINALTTDQLPTEVAQGYKISRSKNRAMINVSVREKQADGEMPITASVHIAAKNLVGKLRNVKLREIKETDPVAVYYIGELPVSNEERIIFDLDITPAGADEPVLLSYRQQFFTQ
jgi:Domain of unknown function (DUF4426)